MRTMYLIYDGRARHDPDAATVLDTADSLQQAREARRHTIVDDAVIYAYDLDRQGNLTNGRMVEAQ